MSWCKKLQQYWKMSVWDPWLDGKRIIKYSYSIILKNLITTLHAFFLHELRRLFHIPKGVWGFYWGFLSAYVYRILHSSFYLCHFFRLWVALISSARSPSPTCFSQRAGNTMVWDKAGKNIPGFFSPAIHSCDETMAYNKVHKQRKLPPDLQEQVRFVSQLFFQQIIWSFTH